jgi:hypothetical protein
MAAKLVYKSAEVRRSTITLWSIVVPNDHHAVAEMTPADDASIPVNVNVLGCAGFHG